MTIYFVTAVSSQGHAVAAYVAAENPDACSAKATARLKGGRITHIVKLCNADLITFNRNKLDKMLSRPDQIEFTTKTMLELVDFQQKQNMKLQAIVNQLQASLEQLKKWSEL